MAIASISRVYAPPTDTTTTSVACSPNLIDLGGASTCIATVTDTVNSAYVPTGTVTFTSSSTTVGTVDSSCTLGVSGMCSVNFAGVAPGHATVTGNYQGDATAMASS